jgi:hypothetical protein
MVITEPGDPSTVHGWQHGESATACGAPVPGGWQANVVGEPFPPADAGELKVCAACAKATA